MELLESDDPKAQLLRQANQQKQALNNEVKLFSEKSEKVIKTALIVGGALAATYLVYKLLSSSDTKKKKKRVKIVTAPADETAEVEEVMESPLTGVITKIGTVLASQLSVFLLALAKEKIGEYLEDKEKRNDASHL
jgi:cell division protein FtsL